MGRHTEEQRRRNMQAVKAKGSKIEKLLARALWDRRYRYRKNYKAVTGKPDFVFLSLKIAVFCDSEFWHGKDWERKKAEIKSNQKFWYQKIEGNIARDREVNRILAEQGWLVLRFWGREILKDTAGCAEAVAYAVERKKSEKQRLIHEKRIARRGR